MIREAERMPRRECVDGLVPSLAGWSTFPRAFVNLLAFGLAIAGGEWVVHQGEYLIEYGRRFGTVMATSPQHSYMGELGLMLAAATILLLTLSAVVVGALSLRLRRLLHLMPAHPGPEGRGRLERFVPAISVRVPARPVLITAALAASGQTAIYLVQENLESASIGAGWPGLGVLFASRHATVVPLHLLIAFYASLLLWTLATLLRGAHAAVRAAAAIAALMASPPEAPLRLMPVARRTPSLCAVQGTQGLRSPPIAIGC
jgi:hypothetical protein